MSLAANGPVFFVASTCLALGAMLGAAHIMTLKVSVRWLAEGRVLAPIALQLARHAGLAAALFVAVWSGGAPALLALAAGILGARAVLLRRERADG